MLKDPRKTILDKDKEITIFDDSYELAEKLRAMSEEADLLGYNAYYLKEAATHIETLFDNYKSLLFIHYPSENKEIDNTSKLDGRETIYIKDLDLSTRTRNCICHIIDNKDDTEISLLDIEAARWLHPSHHSFNKPVRWSSVPNFGKSSFAELRTVMNSYGYNLKQ